LNSKQKNFVRQWYDAFAHSESRPVLSSECMSALAILIQARPQLVFEYIKTTYPSHTCSNSLDTNESAHPQRTSIFPSKPQGQDDSLETANAHLLPATLHLVQKYITTCRRTRPKTDGRRSVNTGPYRCTFGCGYATKRVFDWRRHEETHEPQELWLCTLCSQQDTDKAFLVNRRDKFVRHVREAHEGWKAETVLGLSKVDYRPRGSLGCTICGEKSGGWDERCRHVLWHFEDEVQRGLRRPNV
ncbi:hypothetical protein EJ02DRAFT_316734, partial [Clathrospora elynae]